MANTSASPARSASRSGVPPSPLMSSRSTLASSSMRTIATACVVLECPSGDTRHSTALIRAVHPSPAFLQGFASASKSMATTSLCPEHTADIKAGRPRVSRASTDAPAFNNAPTTPTCPLSAASINGVLAESSEKFGSAANSNRHWTIDEHPEAQANNKGVAPASVAIFGDAFASSSARRQDRRAWALSSVKFAAELTASNTGDQPSELTKFTSA
mmetsp:Transcript_41917/g.115581  ORF Transcript_41917/g.115581 Transcript_41917/m.115581 type:complete len:215 (-) Transcript_41917:504-1148(-)